MYFFCSGSSPVLFPNSYLASYFREILFLEYDMTEFVTFCTLVALFQLAVDYILVKGRLTDNSLWSCLKYYLCT